MAATLPEETAANHSRFRLEVSPLDGLGAEVESFATEPIRPCADVAWSVVVRIQGHPPLDALVHAPARLDCHHAGRRLGLGGRIRRVQDLGPGEQAGQRRLCLLVHSPLAALAEHEDARVFVERSPREVIEQLLTEQAITEADLEWKAGDNGGKRPLVLQYRENDLDLIRRLAARCGWLFAFADRPGELPLRMADSLAELVDEEESVSLAFRPASGQVAAGEAVLRLGMHEGELPDVIHVADDRHERGGVRVEASHEAGHAGSPGRRHYGSGALDPGEADDEARHRHAGEAGAVRGLEITTDCCALRPGILVRLGGIPGMDAETPWRVVQVCHQGDQRAGLEGGGDQVDPGYQNRAWLVAADLDWRPPWPENPVPPGKLTARVAGDSEQVACIDEQGRYRVRFDFDRETPEGADPSSPVHRLQPYGGGDGGMHLPLKPGVLVTVDFINGDPDRPVIAGALPDAAHPSPVTADNPHHHCLRTEGGNELLLDDQPEAPRILLRTAEGEALKLEAGEHGPQAALESPQGDLSLDAGGSIHVEAASDIQFDAGSDMTVQVGGEFKLSTQEGDIHTTAAGEYSIRAEERLALESSEDEIHCQAETELAIESALGLSLHALDGNVNLVAEEDGLEFYSEGGLSLVSGESVLVENDEASIHIDAEGNIALRAGEITLDADDIRDQGSGSIEDN